MIQPQDGLTSRFTEIKKAKKGEKLFQARVRERERERKRMRKSGRKREKERKRKRERESIFNWRERIFKGGERQET